MTVNRADQAGRVAYTLDPTVTPKLDGDTSILTLRVEEDSLDELFADPDLVGDLEEFCAPAPPDEDVMEGYWCSAGHPACHINPYGEVFPCLQLPLPTGNLRRQNFADLW